MSDRNDPRFYEPFPGAGLLPAPVMQPDLERDAREKAEYEANRESTMRRRTAEACAMRELADMRCPQYLKEWGRRHGIPTFAEFAWMAGFAAGYAAGLARLPKEGVDDA